VSIPALAYAFKLDMPKSSEKFLMVCLANYADEFGFCYPSILRLEQDTCCDRKTLIKNIKNLQDAGLLMDTGKRVGVTGSIPVYRLLGLPTASATHYTYRVTDPETGNFYLGKRSFCGDPEADAYRGSGKWPREQIAAGRLLVREVLEVFETPEEASAAEMRLFRQYDLDPLCKNEGTPSKLRAATIAERTRRLGSYAKNGTASEDGEAVPFFRGSGTVFPEKQSQKRYGEPSINRQGNQYPPNPPGGDGRFEDFWSAYPRKVGIDAARRAFEKRQVGVELLATMLNAIKVQKQSTDWTRDGGKYIPHPSTWLNQGRWMDELPVAGSQGASKHAGFDSKDYREGVDDDGSLV
jgi:hypothetical protein